MEEEKKKSVTLNINNIYKYLIYIFIKLNHIIFYLYPGSPIRCRKRKIRSKKFPPIKSPRNPERTTRRCKRHEQNGQLRQMCINQGQTTSRKKRHHSGQKK